MGKKSVFFGIALGALGMFLFGLIALNIDRHVAYTVQSTDDHEIVLKSEHGNFIEIYVENVPDVACFERGALWHVSF